MQRDRIEALLLEAQDHDLGPVAHSLINEALALVREPSRELLLANAAEQFLASLGDGNIADLLDYYQGVFLEALGVDCG